MNNYGLASRLWHGLLIAALLAVGLYAPYAVFHVSPFYTGNRGKEAPAHITSHAIIAPVAPSLDTPQEARIRTEVYKWCGFCHTTNLNGEHLLGPNLHGIFGQVAGTTPNYMDYSDAMMAARDRGLVWTDETIDAYIADPQAFLPGTHMVISIGPISDAETRKAIVAILKRDTMTASPQPPPQGE